MADSLGRNFTINFGPQHPAGRPTTPLYVG